MSEEVSSLHKEKDVKQSHFKPHLDSDFVSEDVYAESYNSFIKVKCENVYGFESIATSSDFSKHASSIDELLQFGVKISYPNGETKLLILQPKNLLYYPIQHRQKILKSMFNNGHIWIGKHNDIFSAGVFPKTWETMILPDKNAIDSIITNRKDGITNMYSDGKEQMFSVFGGLFTSSCIFTIGVIFSIVSSNILPIFGSLGFILLWFKYGMPLLDSVTKHHFEIETPHLWGQVESCETIDTIEPLNTESNGLIYNILTQFTGVWTSVRVTNVVENTDTTVLTLLTTETGFEFTVNCNSPADDSDRYLLNRLKDDLGVGSVRMLENETLLVSLSSLGKENDVCENGVYRLKSN